MTRQVPAFTIQTKDGSETKLATKLVGVPVEPGDVFYVQSGGGGGWGDPAKRDPALDAIDKELGLV